MTLSSAIQNLTSSVNAIWAKINDTSVKTSAALQWLYDHLKVNETNITTLGNTLSNTVTVINAKDASQDVVLTQHTAKLAELEGMLGVVPSIDPQTVKGVYKISSMDLTSALSLLGIAPVNDEYTPEQVFSAIQSVYGDSPNDGTYTLDVTVGDIKIAGVGVIDEADQVVFRVTGGIVALTSTNKMESILGTVDITLQETDPLQTLNLGLSADFLAELVVATQN